MHKIFFNSKDGTRFCGVWHVPLKKTSKAIIFAHGITSNKDEEGIFITLAELLKDHGFAVFRFDFRGSGESDGKSVNLTIRSEIEDLSSVIRLVEKKGYKHLGLLGASFGGSIAVLYSSGHQGELKSLCLWNPVLNYEHCFLAPTTEWIKNRINHMRGDFEKQGWTTLGSKKYIIGKSLFIEMEQFFPYKELKKIKIPTIILHGTEDKHVPYTDSKKYTQDQCELVTIIGASHGFHEKGVIEEQALQTTLNFFKDNL